MSDPRIVASAREQGRRTQSESGASDQAWAVLGWVGVALLIVGGMDFGLAWFPPSFGNREWQFATVTQSFNGLPILLLGVGLLIVASERVGRRWWGIAASAVAGILWVWIVGGSVLWGANVPLALSTVPEELRLGIQRAVAKTAVQSAVYSVLLGYLVWRAVRPRAAGATAA